MANYKIVNADQLDADLTAVADKIRSKGGTSEQLAFPSGYEAAIEAISTGVELNFDVVAYATEEELLAATPKENTIGIITENKITSWVFSATEPAEPAEGMVWIITGTKSDVEFNALKKNGIQVYPLAAKQHVDGVLVSLDAHFYEGGKWTQFSSLWDGELYDIGNQYTDITGGWSGSGWRIPYSSYSTQVISDTNKGLNVKVSAIGTICGLIGTQKKVDLSGYNLLSVEVSSYSHPFWFGLSASKTVWDDEDDTMIALNKITKAGTHTIPVTSISSAYIAVYCFGDEYSSHGTVSKIKLTK